MEKTNFLRLVRDSIGKNFLRNIPSLVSLVLFLRIFDSSSSPNDERYSFSLTTFDPTGRLGQVDRAQQAVAMGTPVIVMAMSSLLNDNKRHALVVLASPQVLPGLFMIDDGTPRFTQITDQLVVTHSGLSADGRVLMTAAQRMATEHEYTFDEQIPCSIFLEEMSLLMQEYTMRPASRPFGACLIVAYLPKASSVTSSSRMNKAAAQSSPKIYRIDVSGNVESLHDCAIINGNNYLQRAGLQEKLKLFTSSMSKHDKGSQGLDKDKIQNQLAELVRETLTPEKLPKKNAGDTQNLNNIEKTMKEWTILTACLSSYEGKNSFSRKRHDP